MTATQEAIANAELAEQENIPLAVQHARPTIEGRDAKAEREAFLRKGRVAFMNAYMDMRMEMTGTHRFDESAMLEMDTIRHMTERAYATRRGVERQS